MLAAAGKAHLSKLERNRTEAVKYRKPSGNMTKEEAISMLEEGIESELIWLRELELNKGKFSVRDYNEWVDVTKKGIESYQRTIENINNGKLKFMEQTNQTPLPETPQLDFSTNWNEKLNCKFFTTLRLMNTEKYFYGAKFNVFLKGKFLKSVEVESVRSITIDEINVFIAGLDTGYSVKETQDILRKMYSKANWETQRLHLVLLKTIKPESNDTTREG